MNAFISYASKDDKFARLLRLKVRSLLGQRAEIFMAEENSLVEGEVSREIKKYISESEVMLLLLSRSSKKSKWVAREVEAAFMSDKKIVTILLDDEAGQNWIWPLVCDRPAIKVEQLSMESLVEALGFEPLALSASAPKRKSSIADFVGGRSGKHGSKRYSRLAGKYAVRKRRRRVAAKSTLG